MAPSWFFLLISFCFVPVQSMRYELEGQEVQWVPGITQPPAEILWLHNGNKVVEFDGVEVVVFGSFKGRVTLNRQTAQLQISDLRLEDSGKYETEMYMDGKWIMKSYELTVMEKVAKPTITCQVNPDSSLSAVLFCSQGFSQPPSPLQFQWISEGKVQPGQSLAISLGGELDEQQYTCQVNNSLSLEKTTFTAKDCNPVSDAGLSAGLIAAIVIIILLIISVCVLTLLLALKHKGSKKDKQLLELRRRGLDEENRPILTNQITAVSPQPLSQLNSDTDGIRSNHSVHSASAVMVKIPETMNLEFLEILIESIIHSSSASATGTFTLELLPETSSAVVTFQSKEKCTKFVQRCSQNLMFKKKQLSVRPLEATQQVLIEGVGELDKDSLNFKAAGVEVENIVFSEDKQCAILTLKDHQAVQKIVQQKLRIKEEEFRVFPYYESLGTALYGKEKPSPKLPSAVSEHIDNGVWAYLNSNQPVADTVHSHMAKHFCKVNFEEQNVTLSPVPSLLQQKDAKVTKQWREVVKSEFTQQLNQISERMEREKSCTTKEVKVSRAVYHIICLDGFKEKLLSIYPHLKMTYQPDNPNLIVTGLADEILELKKSIYDQVMDCKWQNLQADKFVLDLLRDNKQEELTNALFQANGLKAAFEITDNAVQLVARKDGDLKDATDHLKNLLISECVYVTDKTVLNTPEWNQLVRQLQDANVVQFKRIRINTSDKKVVVSGHKDDVAKVSSELITFLTQNHRVEQTFSVRSSAIIEYIQKSSMPWLDKVNDKVVVWFQKDAICLSGRQNHVSECKTLVEKQVAAVAFESFQDSTPGAKKIYKNQEAAHRTLILKDTGCVVQLVEDTTAGRGVLTGGADKPKNVEELLIKTLNADPVDFHICGESKAKVNLAKKKLKDLIKNQYHFLDIPDNAIQSLSERDIADIQRNLGISISTKNNKDQSVLVISGHRPSVYEASNEINIILRKAKEKRDAELARLMAVWQYQSQGFGFKNFNPETSYKLEKALRNQDSQVKVTVEGKLYTVQMPYGPATDHRGVSLEIKRIDLTEGVPHYWDTMPADTTCVSITLNAGTPEYSEIQKQFKQSFHQNIIKIERIQNKDLWKSFKMKKIEMDRRNNHTDNEKQLFRGANEETIPFVNEFGFSRSDAGKKELGYGHGLYFEVDASQVAQDPFSKPNPKGEKFMYVSRVLTGKFTDGQRGMVEPPINFTSGSRFDSVVDKVKKPSLFVIFNCDYVYPEYLITFS